MTLILSLGFSIELVFRRENVYARQSTLPYVCARIWPLLYAGWLEQAMSGFRRGQEEYMQKANDRRVRVLLVTVWPGEINTLLFFVGLRF